MTTVPSGEASTPAHGGSRPSESPAVGSQSQVSLLADAPGAGAAASAEQQDVDLASGKPATSKPTSASGYEDKLKDEAAARHRPEPQEAMGWLTCPAPEALKMSTSLPNSVWDELAQNMKTTLSLQISRSDSLSKKQTLQAVSVLDREKDLDPHTPSAKVLFLQAVPAVSTADAASQPDTWATGTTEAAETPEGPEALSPDTEASPLAEPQVVTEGRSVDRSGELQAQPVAPSPGGSIPTLPGAPTVALGRGPLDPSLYMACEENAYMCSMTSLLAGGEEAISSLADILLWPEMAMDIATGILVSGSSSMTYLLHSPGPRLRPLSSLLRNASLAFSSRLRARAGSVLRSITHVLERIERRTVEGLCSAARYLTGHLAPYHSGLRCD
ncbi:testis-expressed protein 44 [Pteronotus mesoamericanus]|uniref:testis-expressed protein 44 n=1 Tax=Pteronotus mesoamericanus TaxID=1884717 RepID=UPI0023EC40AD|nr:testis-expressed protein 44 [Pteronotus parnellii mesoamericanus]